jgi:hypothetical protein
LQQANKLKTRKQENKKTRKQEKKDASRVRNKDLKMLHYVVGGTVITMIGGNIANTMITGIMEILYSGASYLRHGTESNKMITTIRLRIDEMDIPIKLKLVQNLLETLPQNATNSILEEGLVDIMFKIKSLLEWIEYEIERHNAKWFAGYRSIMVDSKLDELAHLVKVLDGRIGLLMVGRPDSTRI